MRIITLTILILSIIPLNLHSQVSHNITETITYQGSNKKLGQVTLQLGIKELNQAYGTILINSDSETIDHGGEETTLNKNNQYVSNNGHVELHFESGTWIHIYNYREEKIKMEYYNIPLNGVKPIKLTLNKRS